MSGTPALIRVKRRITDDPTEVIVLSAKRRKANTEGAEDEDVRILKLAGRMDKGDEEDLNKTISKLIDKRNLPNFAELKERYKKRVKDSSTVGERSKVKEKEREEERFRVVNINRAIKIEELEAWSESSDTSPITDETPPIFHLYDVVKEEEKASGRKPEEKLSCNGIEMIREYRSKTTDEENYVYDVYFAEEDGFADFDDSLLDSLVSIQPLNTGLDLMYEEYREDPTEFRYEDDSDSNDEDNINNEYPEEEDEDDFDDSYGDYTDELGMRLGKVRMHAEEEEDLSSDPEDGLTFSRSMEDDANRHGSSYARFKQRILKELKEDDLLETSESDLESDPDILDYY